MAPLKEFVDRATVERIAAALEQAGSPPTEPFVDEATAGLDDLELRPRIDAVASALAAFVLTAPGAGRPSGGDAADARADPGEAARAGLALLVRATETGTPDGWAAWPLVEAAGQVALDPPATARVPVAEGLEALGRLTRYASAEFALRPFVEAFPDETFAVLAAWAAGDDPHRRRLVSEGTRPRLPWGRRLRALQADPTPTLALLDVLVDDPDETVRRSVANHLNDVSKDHPRRALDVAAGWLERAAPPAPGRATAEQVRAVVRHGLRTLLRAGDPEAMALLGHGTGTVRVVAFGVDRPEVRVGERLTFGYTLRNDGDAPADVALHHVLHRVVADGSRSARARSAGTRRVEPGAEVVSRRSLSFAPVTVRRWYPGTHRLELQVDGRVVAGCEFEVLPGAGDPEPKAGG